ncbi:MAG: hypothetical protein ACXWJZ_17135, partial [Burkholderiaceae bacterium]
KKTMALTTQVLTAITYAVMEGGDGGKWLGEAYVSFYRGGKNKVDLRDIGKLDAENLNLFFQMLTLRRRPNWSDEELYQAELKIKATLKKGKEQAIWC